jgi:glycosyltransferase involved in cell wall biosynthesis
MLDMRVVDRAEHEQPRHPPDDKRCDHWPVTARVAVIIPCYGEGALVLDAARSVQEDEPVEIVVVDNASPDEATRDALRTLEVEGIVVLRRPENGGPAVARTAGLAATSAPYVLPLDGDDLAIPGALARMADALDADPGAAACVGDIVEFGEHDLVRRVPDRLDPFRVAYTNEYPVTALFRRSVVEAADAWRPVPGLDGYEDWRCWMALAEHGARIVHLGAPGYRRRLHGRRLNHVARSHHRANYEAMRHAHPLLFARLPELRRASDLSPVHKLLYPLVYGARAEVPFERRLKPWFDRLGIWTRADRGARAGTPGRRHAA